MPKRRIAMLSLHSCPLGRLGGRDVGGMNVYVRELARALGVLGYAVDVYTRAHDPSDPLAASPFENVRLIHICAGQAEDMGKIAQFSHLTEFIRNMTDFVKTDGVYYDLIHSHYWLSSLAGQHFGNAWRVPQIVMFHTLGAVKNSLPVGEQEPTIRLAAERDIARMCRGIVVATEAEKKWLIRAYGVGAERVSIVPGGIDPELFRPVAKPAARRALGLKAGERFVLSVGRIEPLKGLERLVEAFSLLHQPNLKLIVVGGDAYSQAEVARLKSRAMELGVGARIEFPGTVLQECLPLYYSAAEVTVVASYYESFCLVIPESLSCGTPVVSTKVGVAPELVKGENGRVAEGTPQALAQAIEEVLDERCIPEARRTRRAAAAAYSWAAVTMRIAAIYEATLRSEPTVPAGG
ncbi:MAG: glycosyltransferase [Dehalococcoidia bacterium]|nr:glycosyltransferase [Dehalococcoidia bacterium]